MLQNISIQNFRCFHDAHFTDFNQINLLGGQNNAGKTALLEAIYLFTRSHFDSTIGDIFRYRKINKVELEKYLIDGKIYNNLFLNEDNNKEIVFSIDKDSRNSRKESKDGLKQKVNENYRSIAFDKNSHGLKPVLNFPFSVSKIIFIPTDYRLVSIDLVKFYDELEMQGNEDILLNALQTIDPNLEKIRSFASNPLTLYIKRKGENYLPISFFGDAMNKMAHYILHIIQAKNGILLIDEIENGIHYTHQKEFWQSLLALAKAFDVQIFATSHSLEMIKAFNEVAMQPDFEEKSTYFEMVKHAKTGEITANALSMSMLKHEISKNNPFRGE